MHHNLQHKEFFGQIFNDFCKVVITTTWVVVVALWWFCILLSLKVLFVEGRRKEGRRNEGRERASIRTCLYENLHMEINK